MTGKFNMGNTKAGKLTGEAVMRIREQYATGLYTMNMLARQEGVTRNTISDVVHGVTWQHLPGVEPVHVVDEAAMRSQRKLEAMLAGAGELAEPVNEVDDETLAAMQHAVESMPQPDFLKPNADQAARMAAYGVRPPTPKELIEQLARPTPATERGPISAVAERGDELAREMSEKAAAARVVHAAERGKPAIQAKPAAGEPMGAEEALPGIANRQPSPTGELERFLSQVTEESGK